MIHCSGYLRPSAEWSTFNSEAQARSRHKLTDETGARSGKRGKSGRLDSGRDNGCLTWLL